MNRLKALVAALAIVLSGCGQPEPVVFRAQISDEPGTLDPALVSDTISQGIAERLFDEFSRYHPIVNLNGRSDGHLFRPQIQF